MKGSMSEIGAYVALAERLADTARPIVMGYFRTGVAIDTKGDTSPVTAADREAELAIRRLIEASFPDHGILGEEHGGQNLEADLVWVIDPIDGTKSFVTGKPLFGTLIALVRDGDPIVGVIDMPALGERWVGIEGRPTVYNGRQVRVRACHQLADAWLYATSPQMFEGADAEAFERLRRGCRAAVYGADCYAYGLLASGTVDLVCEAKMMPYDYCALVPVVRGAGGVISDWQGRALCLQSVESPARGRVLASGNERLHAAALATLQG
jgi:inositol-phosphate phosphatase/L-galactose 1-phosphate phosphatase/histidinol-phosphatase